MLSPETHTLIHFEDEDCTAVVPLVRVSPLVESHQLCVGDMCDVLWNSRKRYRGILLFTGEYMCGILQNSKLGVGQILYQVFKIMSLFHIVLFYMVYKSSQKRVVVGKWPTAILNSVMCYTLWQ